MAFSSIYLTAQQPTSRNYDPSSSLKWITSHPRDVFIASPFSGYSALLLVATPACYANICSFPHGVLVSEGAEFGGWSGVGNGVNGLVGTSFPGLRKQGGKAVRTTFFCLFVIVALSNYYSWKSMLGEHCCIYR